MINQYRTLVLNLSDAGNPNEFISPGFTALPLPQGLKGFHDLLFPPGQSRFYWQFLYYYYEELLKAAGQTQFLTQMDSRITYDTALLGQYFKLDQVSTPQSNTTDFSLLLTGSYQPPAVVEDHYETFLVKQVGSTAAVTVFSNTEGLYLSGGSASQNPISIPITFTGNSSNPIPIGVSGLIATITGVAANFTSGSNRQWAFTAQTPFEFDFPSFFKDLTYNSFVTNSMLASAPADPTSENLWSSHFNSVYRFAGLLNAYFVRVNALWAT